MFYLIHYGWKPSWSLAPIFTGSVPHPLHLRALRLPKTLLADAFNRAEERFHTCEVAYDPTRVMVVEMGNQGQLIVTMFDPDRTFYLPYGEHWEIDLYDPYGNVVRTLTPDDFPDPENNGKLAA